MQETPTIPVPPPRNISRLFVRLALVLAILALGAFVLRWLKTSGIMEWTLDWLNGLGPWAPVMFVIIYVAWVVAFGPGLVPTLGAGILFGFTRGSIYVLAAALIAAVVCFVISRHFGRAWIAKKLSGHPAFKALDDAVARDGWKIVALMRLAPVFPFALSNYAFGLTRVPLLHYIIASLTMIPATMMYVYFGVLIGDVSGIQRGPALPLWLKLCIAGAALLVTIYIARFARRAIKAAPGQGELSS